MALTIEELRKPKDGAFYKSPRRLCVTADDELVDETDPRAVRLLVGEGGELPTAVAAHYGLIADEGESGAESSQDEAQGGEDEDDEDADEGDQGAETPISRMRKDDLVALAVERGIEGAEDLTVAELRERLSGE